MRFTLISIMKRLAPDPLIGLLKKMRGIFGFLASNLQTIIYKPSLKHILAGNKDRKGIVVYPPTIDWNWMKQRPHHMLSEFARAGYVVFFCPPQNRTDIVIGFRKIERNLYLCGTIKLLYDLENPILLVGWTEHLKDIAKFQNPLIIYDYLDDLSVSSEVVDQEKIDKHLQLLTQAQIVCATADHLYKDASKVRSDVLFCPNAVKYQDFHLSNRPGIPEDMADIVAEGKPIIGYYGALAKWFDFELLKYAALACPEYNFVLIGPNYDGTMDKYSLKTVTNIYCLGQKKYEQLPAYLYFMTVATIPFLVNQITLSTSPVKLYEYMAGGKPVVCTALPECGRYQTVSIAGSKQDFVKKLDQSVRVAEDPKHKQLLNQEALANTWEARIEQIIARIREVQDEDSLPNQT